MDREYEVDHDGTCPRCGHSPIHYRDCTNFCENGWFDCADDDPINYMPGEEDTICTECWGTGVERWCPKCGCNLQRLEYARELARERTGTD